MIKHEVVQEWSMTSKELAEKLDEGFKIEAIIPCAKSYYQGSQLETRCLYVLVKTTESVAD